MFALLSLVATLHATPVQTTREVTIVASPTWVCGPPRKLENDSIMTVKECRTK